MSEILVTGEIFIAIVMTGKLCPPGRFDRGVPRGLRRAGNRGNAGKGRSSPDHATGGQLFSRAKEAFMEPLGPKRRSVRGGRRRPVEEVESPFSLSDKPLPEKRSIRGKIYLFGIMVPLLAAALFLGVLLLQGGRLIHTGVYPPLLFQQVVEGKPMDRVLEILGPPSRLGEGGEVTRWVYEPGIFDFSLYPFLPWNTPVMNGILVRDQALHRSPRRILVEFVQEKAVPGGQEGGSGQRGREKAPTANVRLEY